VVEGRTGTSHTPPNQPRISGFENAIAPIDLIGRIHLSRSAAANTEHRAQGDGLLETLERVAGDEGGFAGARSGLACARGRHQGA
jgi:hypothetical protein